MRFLFYTHSLVSDWNHGNAHFLRGVMRELVSLGHQALALEPAGGWSRRNLEEQAGLQAAERFAEDFPELESRIYDADFDHAAMVAQADVVVVHEWTDPALVARLGRLRRAGGRFCLLFHDTHHRAVSDEEAIAGMMLQDYDAVLAFGETLRERYLATGWGRRVFTWHEAADDRLFHPIDTPRQRDLVWIGNWGDDERTEELHRFLIEPTAALGLSGTVHGVRWPEPALAALREAGLDYRGWLPNAAVPRAFAQHRLTLHIPRRPYVAALPGIPTIRVFEALACGIPLICAPWSDAEGLFTPGQDFLMAGDGTAMRGCIRDVLNDPALAASLVRSGLATIRARHTCRHRVEELLAILATLAAPAEAVP
ncbi:CgeB family protein [Falsiroseomonas selenitidurans]|uniref:Glycosyltransferase n=1 Tax=Falsiroseomonas selenitidurans TaxID=2716335 RepID=A0ABX1E187_9PROT|nr:glycosyltransferase [Falsiroseomonas selenitidurans]NKC30538.1 glycosyltransferase [Falsiroseomonas selenitidurans]